VTDNTIADYKIIPDRGSVNPFVRANKAGSGGAQSPPEPITGNKIYFTRYPVG
jgi:hypothetical protein